MKGHSFFEQVNQTWRQGWYLPVRSDWSYKLKKVFIPEPLKDPFEAHFGERILFERDFLDWFADQLRRPTH